MSNVELRLSFLILAAALPATGCSSLKLERFAPPGIVKYEDIASEKPQDPIIKERIAERRETINGKYPLLSQTPSEKDVPEARPVGQVEAEIGELTAARQVLLDEIDAARAEGADIGSDGSLLDRREALNKDVELDQAEAQKTRDSFDANEQ